MQTLRHSSPSYKVAEAGFYWGSHPLPPSSFPQGGQGLQSPSSLTGLAGSQASLATLLWFSFDALLLRPLIYPFLLQVLVEAFCLQARGLALTVSKTSHSPCFCDASGGRQRFISHTRGILRDQCSGEWNTTFVFLLPFPPDPIPSFPTAAPLGTSGPRAVC